MNQLGALLILCIATGLSCVKGKQATSAPAAKESYVIRVLDKYTRKPISGVTVALQKCNGSFGACSSFIDISTGKTNDSGVATFPHLETAEFITANIDKYWSNRAELSCRQVELTPVSTIKLLIKKTTTYLPTDFLNIVVYDPGCPSYLCWSSKVTPGLPTDTVMYLKTQGNNNNRISWYMNYNGNSDYWHSLQSVYIDRFDTAAISMSY